MDKSTLGKIECPNCHELIPVAETMEAQKKLEELWTVPKVAKYLDLNPVTVYRWLAAGKMFDPVKIVRFTNRVRVPRSEVERIAGTIKKGLETNL